MRVVTELPMPKIAHNLSDFIEWAKHCGHYQVVDMYANFTQCLKAMEPTVEETDGE